MTGVTHNEEMFGREERHEIDLHEGWEPGQLTFEYRHGRLNHTERGTFVIPASLWVKLPTGRTLVTRADELPELKTVTLHHETPDEVRITFYGRERHPEQAHHLLDAPWERFTVSTPHHTLRDHVFQDRLFPPTFDGATLLQHDILNFEGKWISRRGWD